MKIIYGFVFAVLIVTHVNAQNLVPDPSFEDYDTCPKSINTYLTEFDMKSWFVPTKGTSDYINACNNAGNNFVGVPMNIFGHQAASDSNGYVGIVLRAHSIFDYKEYVSCKLTGCESANCPLTPGKFYKVSIDVSRADYTNIACDGLGVYFFTDTLPASYKASWMTTLPFVPKIDYTGYGVITDTVNWVTLVDTFQADSAYNYMIIGGVTSELDQTVIDPVSDGPLESAYYYLDNVKVEEVSVNGIENLEASKLAIIPNPFREKATLRMSRYNGRPYNVSLINTIGQTVWQRSNVTDNELIIERQSLPAGIYYYQLTMKEQLTERGKLVIE